MQSRIKTYRSYGGRIKMNYKDMKDIEIIKFFNELPVNPGYFANYLSQYRDIIQILHNLDFEYCFVEQLYNIYKDTVDKGMSYNTFIRIIKKGEEDKFWGVFKSNGYSVLYLKSNSFLCYYRKKRSSLEKDRITTKMLVRTAMVFSLKYAKVERVKIPNDEIYKCITYDGKLQYVALTTSNSFKATKIKRVNFVTSLAVLFDLNEENTLKREHIDIHIISVYPLQSAIYEDLKKLLNDSDFGFSNEIIDISKYFNGLPIDQH